MDYKYWVLLYIVAAAITVITSVLVTKKRNNKLWVDAADPNHEYHVYWLRVHERIEEPKKQKEAFLASVSLAKRNPIRNMTQEDIDELKKMIQQMENKE